MTDAHYDVGCVKEEVSEDSSDAAESALPAWAQFIFPPSLSPAIKTEEEDEPLYDYFDAVASGSNTSDIDAMFTRAPEGLRAFRRIDEPQLTELLEQKNSELVELFKAIGMLPRGRACPSCGGATSFIVDRSNFTGQSLRCKDRKRCFRKTSILKGTLFERTRMQGRELLKLLFLFARGDYTIRMIGDEIRRADNTRPSDILIIDWLSHCRELAAFCVQGQSSTPIGGAGKEVLIETTSLLRWKQDFGVRIPREFLIVCGMELEDPSATFAKLIEDTEEKLRELLGKFVRSGSVITRKKEHSSEDVNQQSPLGFDYTWLLKVAGERGEREEGGRKVAHLEKEAHQGSQEDKEVPFTTPTLSIAEHIFRQRYAREDAMFVLLYYASVLYDGL